MEIKGISREDYERTGSEDEFLLPFAAIAQIFEQHCRVYDGQEESGLFDVDTGNRQEQGMGLEGISPYQRIRVARVALEYRYAGEDYGEGTIFPVWSFYGSAEKGYRRPAGTEAEILNAEIPEAAMSGKNGEEVLLVSIGARDGVIY